MFDKITNNVELEFLKILEIEIQGNKLVNTKTNNDFFPTKTNMINYGSYYYKCDNILIEFTVMNNQPVAVNVWKDGLEYRAWEMQNGGRGVSIRRVDDEISKQIVIAPQISNNFIKTTIAYEKEPLLDLIGYKYINSSFLDSLITIDDFYYGDMDLNNYREALVDTIEDTFNDKLICDEFKRFLDFFSKEFEKLLGFPVYNKDKFIENLGKEVSTVNGQFAAKVSSLSSINDNEIGELSPNLKDNSLSYIGKVIDFEKKVKELVKERQEKLEMINKKRDLLDSYIARYNRYQDPKRRRKK